MALSSRKLLSIVDDPHRCFQLLAIKLKHLHREKIPNGGCVRKKIPIIKWVDIGLVQRRQKKMRGTHLKDENPHRDGKDSRGEVA